MGSSESFPGAISALAVAFFLVLIFPAHGQINSPCSASMISSLSPCMSVITNSTANGTSPTGDCCNSLRSLTSGGMDCLCLILTGNVPLPLPINRTAAISLPRACNMPGVPLQCKASGAPVPAPGPTSFGPTLSPATPGSVVPQPISPAQGPAADSTPGLTPPSIVNSSPPTSTTGSRQSLNPSSATPSYSFPPYLLLVLGYVFF